MQRSLFVSHHAPTYLLLALWSSASMSTVYISHIELCCIIMFVHTAARDEKRGLRHLLEWHDVSAHIFQRKRKKETEIALMSIKCVNMQRAIRNSWSGLYIVGNTSLATITHIRITPRMPAIEECQEAPRPMSVSVGCVEHRRMCVWFTNAGNHFTANGFAHGKAESMYCFRIWLSRTSQHLCGWKTCCWNFQALDCMLAASCNPRLGTLWGLCPPLLDSCKVGRLAPSAWNDMFPRFSV